ncbi:MULTISPECIES: DUF7018 domain-containing (lipo)protein [Bacillus]|uniref:DUF7018 domain-containing (lipo)protein n=1 Tax=Bacillus TaxID=1386 RepID=UPI00215B15D5|nr:hypothetical protein [Bacillus pseudomycoides]MCR8856710.1 hypothetical protein [Bacillus pseudomycoides]
MKLKTLVVTVPIILLTGTVVGFGDGQTTLFTKVTSIGVSILLSAWLVKRSINKKKPRTTFIERVFELDEEGRLTSTVDYVAKVQGVCMVWTEAQNKFGELEKKDPTFLHTHKELKQVVSEMKSANKKLREIKPPKQYDSLQEDLSKSLVVFDKGLDTMVEGFTTLDETKIDKSSELIDEGSDGLMKGLGIILSLTKTEA